MVTTKQKIQYALISLMDENNTKGTELADAIGVKKQSVSGWRRGESSMDIENMIAVCNYYGISLDEFVGRGSDLEIGLVDVTLDTDEHHLIELFHQMDDGQQALMLALAEEFARKA